MYFMIWHYLFRHILIYSLYTNWSQYVSANKCLLKKLNLRKTLAATSTKVTFENELFKKFIMVSFLKKRVHVDYSQTVLNKHQLLDFYGYELNVDEIWVHWITESWIVWGQLKPSCLWLIMESKPNWLTM